MMMMMMAAERGHHFQESDLENKKEKKMLSIKPACSRLFFWLEGLTGLATVASAMATDGLDLITIYSFFLLEYVQASQLNPSLSNADEESEFNESFWVYVCVDVDAANIMSTSIDAGWTTDLVRPIFHSTLSSPLSFSLLKQKLNSLFPQVELGSI